MRGTVAAVRFPSATFRVSASYITRMRDVMDHRGPDGSGLWIRSDAVAGRPMRAWPRNKRLHPMTLVSSSGALYRSGFHNGVSWKVSELRILTDQLNPQ